jgi:LysM domain
MSATTVSRDSAVVVPGGRRAHLRLVTELPRERPGLRLTRRGRVVVGILGWSFVLVAGAIVVLLATLALGGPADAGDQPAKAVPVSKHVVLPGETLWGIASHWSPGEDPREAIARIVDLNALPGVEVRAGQTLYLPQRN